MPFDTSQRSYQSLRNIVAERTESIVAWVGSGLSAGAQLPTWSTLMARLLTELDSKIISFSDEDAERLRRQSNTIKKQHNPWIAFEQLRSALGFATWRDTIREALRPSATMTAPQAYGLLWKLRISGILNLNLDRLATRAFVETHPGREPIEFNGKEVRSHVHVLKSPRQFICNLHGDLELVTK